jgi:c-di-GMP-binding flagellar brake protein YcgR
MEAGAVKTEVTIEQPRAESVSAIQSAPNRRKTRRFPCEGAAEVLVLGGALRFTGEVRDLSATGCCVLTKVMFTLERGTQVEVTLVVDRVHFRVAAGVRSNRITRCVGLEFMNVSPRCARLIQDLIVELGAKAEREAAGAGV